MVDWTEESIPIPVSATLNVNMPCSGLFGTALDRYLDSPPVSKLHGIPDQVQENLTKTDRISYHSSRTAGSKTASQFQAFCSGRLEEQGHRILNQFSQVKCNGFQVILPASILEKSRMSLMISSKATPE